MPFKEQSENAVAEHELGNDLEWLWGNDEEEWKNWSTAPKNMSHKQFNELQIKEMTGERTKRAYEKVFGKMTPEPSELMLVQFFLNRGGSVFFRRRNFQYFNEIDPAKITEYYEGRLWEDEIKKINPVILTQL